LFYDKGLIMSSSFFHFIKILILCCCGSLFATSWAAQIYVTATPAPEQNNQTVNSSAADNKTPSAITANSGVNPALSAITAPQNNNPVTPQPSSAPQNGIIPTPQPVLTPSAPTSTNSNGFAPSTPSSINTFLQWLHRQREKCLDEKLYSSTSSQYATATLLSMQLGQN
jgi:hypothetical protein